jgi:hypothetical protein
MTNINVLRACWTLAPETAADEGDRAAVLSRHADELAVLLEQARAEIIASGFVGYAGPDPLMDTLIDALDLPASVIVVQTWME